MATFTERLKIILDLEGQKVETGLKKIRDSVKEADGFVGKMTAGVKGASQAFFGSPAALAGAATVGAAALAKVTSEASDLGVEIGKLSDATGLSTEQASRWIEVAKDMGIGSDTLAGLLEKMEKNIGASPDKFKELGIFIQHASDGTVDMNGTMLTAVDRLNAIQDPTQRAAAEASLFGKSWASASELLKMSSTDIKKRLDDVGAAKVYNSQQVSDARAFRDALQDLKNTGEDLAIEIGKDLLPAITLVAKGAVIAAKGVKGFVDVAEQVGGVHHDANVEANKFADTLKRYGDAVWKSDYAVQHHIKSQEDWMAAEFAGKVSADDLTKSVEALRSKNVDATAAQSEHRQGTYDWTNAQDDATAAAKKLADAQDLVTKAAEESQHALEDLKTAEDEIYKGEYDKIQANKDYAQAMSDLGDAIKGKGGKSIPDALEEAAVKFAEVNQHAADSKEGIQDQINFLAVIETGYKKGSPAWNAIEDMKNQLITAQTIASQKVTAEVIGLNPQAQNAVANGGTWIDNVHITVSDPSPQAVINAITAWERRNGKAWRQ